MAMTDTENKIKLLEFRLHCLAVNGRANDGTRRKISREIRRLQKKLADSGN